MTKRKRFLKTDLSIPAVGYDIENEIFIVPRDALEIENTVIHFPEGSRYRTFGFTGWYGVGIDIITYACKIQIERFLAKQDSEVEVNTVLSYCLSGLTYFLEYLAVLSAALGRDLTLQDINRDVLDGYIQFLNTEPISIVTKKNRYTATKPVLKALCRRGLVKEIIGGDKSTFPSNPFPDSHNGAKGEKPLTKAERNSVLVALRTEVMSIFSSSEATSEVLAYAYLIVALHTGANLTPLLEMPPDCLKPHPKADTLFLTLFKRRGHATRGIIIRNEESVERTVETLSTLRPTVAKLVRRAIELSEALREEAPYHYKNRVWLYRVRTKTQHVDAGEISSLNPGTVALAIRHLVKRHNLVDSDGHPLRLNVGRLRKTFVNRIYEILDGDVIATSAASGSSISVTDTHYLQPGEDAKKNWRFMGIALTNELLTHTIGATERTPVGGCTDVRNGQYAPRTGGQICMNFLNCIRCKNYVVTADDLYRLFSFYWRILDERARMNIRRWKKTFSHIIRIIDRDIVSVGIEKKVFTDNSVSEARELARMRPHPFWQDTFAISTILDLTK